MGPNGRQYGTEDHTEQQYHIAQCEQLRLVHAPREQKEAEEDEELHRAVHTDDGEGPVGEVELQQAHRERQTVEQCQRGDDGRLLQLEDVPLVEVLQFGILKPPVVEQPREGHLAVRVHHFHLVIHDVNGVGVG